MSSFNIDWSENRRVNFSLEDNETHLFYKTDEEIRSTWYTSDEKKRFQKNALRDAQVFYYLKSDNNVKVDLSLCENRVCSWGLERTISKKAGQKTQELRDRVRRAVLVLQELQGRRPISSGVNKMVFSDVTREVNKVSTERALQIGFYYQKRVRELAEQMCAPQ